MGIIAIREKLKINKFTKRGRLNVGSIATRKIR
jgi:hypothetical protein